MSKLISRVLKEEDYIVVYQKLLKLETIYKKHKLDGYFFETSEELKRLREKMLAIKEKDSWPEFVIKPIYISPLYDKGEFKKEFIVEFPFIEGLSLKEYINNNKIDFKTCIKFISSLEKRIMAEKDIVFPDLANTSNIIILPGEKDYMLIDPDDIQFGEYTSNGCAALLGTRPMFSDSDDFSCGINKCLIDKQTVNKQLDLRSMYALFYYILHKNYFYPVIVEKEKQDYIQSLKECNVPEGSLLYKNTFLTLSDDDENKPISEALYELLDAGYEFELLSNDAGGFKYTLQNKKKIY